MTRPNSKDDLQWERSDWWGDSNGGKAGRPGGQGGCARQAAGIARGPQTPRHKGGRKAAGETEVQPTGEGQARDRAPDPGTGEAGGPAGEAVGEPLGRSLSCLTTL